MSSCIPRPVWDWNLLQSVGVVSSVGPNVYSVGASRCSEKCLGMNRRPLCQDPCVCEPFSSMKEGGCLSPFVDPFSATEGDSFSDCHVHRMSIARLHH